MQPKNIQIRAFFFVMSISSSQRCRPQSRSSHWTSIRSQLLAVSDVKSETRRGKLCSTQEKSKNFPILFGAFDIRRTPRVYIYLQLPSVSVCGVAKEKKKNSRKKNYFCVEKKFPNFQRGDDGKMAE